MQRFFKKTLKFIGYFFFWFTALVLVYLACAFCLSRITVSREEVPLRDITIYIKTNGVHTDLVVPVKNNLHNWAQEVKFSNTHLTDTSAIQWLALGWGDKGFYLQTPTWSKLKTSVAFKAATGLSSTAMHATFYKSIALNARSRKIMVSADQYLRLVKYIYQSFKTDSTGHVIPIVTNANYSHADAFYEGTGHYSMFKTCNSWANAALKYSGQKACLWTAFDTGIFLKYE